MPSKELQQQMYGLTGKSTAQRATLASLLGLWLILIYWLLLGGGIPVVASWIGWDWHSLNSARCAVLTAAFSIYFVRLLFTIFTFLRRGMSWQEVFTIGPWVLFIFLLIGIAGALNSTPLGISAVAGCIFFLVGSWMNSWAEYSRHVWKRRPENKGRLYTEGLFRVTRHPNYLGDLLSFSGLCLFSGLWFTWIVPILMFVLFTFVNIPVLDAHLHEHYGKQFEIYAGRTAKLIPFLY